MSKKSILVLLVTVCLFFQFGFATDATATDLSLVSFSSGALLVEKTPEYSSGWGNVWIMDENPRTGWCCPKGKVLNNVSVIELAEKSVFDRLEFDTGNVEKRCMAQKTLLLNFRMMVPQKGLQKSRVCHWLSRKTNRAFR